MTKLTRTVIERAVAQAAGAILWCPEVPGFGVRISKGGTKTFIVQYRNKHGKTRRFKLGRVTVIGLEEARKQARIVINRAAAGEDPSEERKTNRQYTSVSALCDEYMAAAEQGLVRYRGKPLAKATRLRDRGRLAWHIKPLIGNLPVSEVRRHHIVKMHDDIVLGRTSRTVQGKNRRFKVIGGEGTARKCVFLVSAIYSYAIRKGYIEDRNPAHGIEVTPDRKRQRFLSNEEYRRLGSALRRHRELAIPETMANIFWGIALTGMRKGEVKNLEAAEVTTIRNGIYLKKSKTGPGQRAVGSVALDFFRSHVREGADYVFPSRVRGTALSDFGDHPRKLFKAAGLNDVTLHTLRHSFASHAANELGLTELFIRGLLAHASKSQTGDYIHLVDEGLRAAADKVCNSIAALMEFPGVAPSTQDTVPNTADVATKIECTD